MTVLVFASCGDDVDKDFRGMWQLQSQNNLYLCFQGPVVAARVVEGHGSLDAFGHYEHTGDSLFVVFYSDNNEESPQYLTDQFRFWQYDNMRFRIQTLTDSEMILTSGDDSWYFKRYY